ncbi:Golgi apyrase [Cryptotrichosporon argae]
MAPSVPTSSTHYALVVDAGSSGSRLQIYAWRDAELERAEILAEVRQAEIEGLDGPRARGRWWLGGSDGVNAKGKGKETEADMQRKALRRLVRVGKGVEGDDWVKRVEPGISTVSPDDIPRYLGPLLTHALQHIPPSQHGSTPVYVLATAGMRLLPDAEQAAILASTCTLLRRDYPFAVETASAAGPCGDSVRVISGEEEGMWGWVAVNYLMDGFGHAPDAADTGTGDPALLPLPELAAPPPDSSKESVTPVDVNHHSPTFGFLDMGGASTQLAFSPTAAELARSGFPLDRLGRVELRLLSGEAVQWPVFVASWLGFGTNRVRERYADALITTWSANAPADRTVPIDDPCLPVGLVVPSLDPAEHPDLRGTGSFAACLAALRPLLAHDAPCPAEHCLFGGIPTPHIDFSRDDQRGFIGISEYWYTAQQVLGLGGVWDWGEWERGMSGYCAREWTEIEDAVEKEKGWRGAEVELSRLQMQCFKGAWISNVLHDGIGIPRLVDAGGNVTLVPTPGGVNAEAERRAREKGLLAAGAASWSSSSAPAPRPHFQALDEVGDTAISWTLGKVVIEASRGVRPAPARASWWAATSPLAFSWDRTLGPVGVQTVWAYAFVGFVVLALAFSALRRRSPLGVLLKRRRRGPDDIELSPSAIAAVNAAANANPASAAATPPKRFAVPLGLGRFRLWTRRLTHTIRRMSVADRRRHSAPSPAGTYPGFFSQPPSPRGLGPVGSGSGSGATSGSGSSGFFTPALSLARAGAAPTADATSPPRLKPGPRPFRPRQNSGNTDQAGWNDPPGSLFASLGTSSSISSLGAAASGTGTAAASAGTDDEHAYAYGAAVLTPTAGNGLEAALALSRNSSRVNLSDMGLAQRTLSRAATPLYEDRTP